MKSLTADDLGCYRVACEKVFETCIQTCAFWSTLWPILTFEFTHSCAIFWIRSLVCHFYLSVPVLSQSLNFIIPFLLCTLYFCYVICPCPSSSGPTPCFLSNVSSRTVNIDGRPQGPIHIFCKNFK